MNLARFVPFFCLFLASTFAPLLRAAPLVLGIRGQEDKVAEFASKSGAQVLPSSTIEFGNGNTFVRLQGEVTHRDVVLLLPKDLSADQLMEALIKIRTAKTEGARAIAVKSPVLLRNIKLTDVSNNTANFLEDLLTTAGVQQIKEANRAIRSPAPRPVKLNNSDVEGTAIITSQGKSPLAEDLAEKTGFRYIPPGKKAPVQAAVYLVSETSSPVNKNFFDLLTQIQRYKTASQPVHLFTPYLPYARSDKKDQPGVTVTGRLIADLIEGAGTTTATFVRAHAPQSQGFFSIPTFQLTSRPTITEYLKELGIDVVIAPDAGAQKETTLFADLIDRPVGVANKQRDPLTGKAKLIDVSGPSVKGKKVVIIDDETATGGTLGKVADLLKSQGAEEVYAVVTHLAGNAKDAIESASLKQIIVTDTIPPSVNDPKFKVLSMASELSDHVQGIEKNRRADLASDCRSSLSRVLGRNFGPIKAEVN